MIKKFAFHLAIAALLAVLLLVLTSRLPHETENPHCTEPICNGCYVLPPA